jgi:hypothetical protein
VKPIKFVTVDLNSAEKSRLCGVMPVLMIETNLSIFLAKFLRRVRSRRYEAKEVPEGGTPSSPESAQRSSSVEVKQLIIADTFKKSTNSSQFAAGVSAEELFNFIWVRYSQFFCL